MVDGQVGAVGRHVTLRVVMGLGLVKDHVQIKTQLMAVRTTQAQVREVVFYLRSLGCIHNMLQRKIFYRKLAK